jgi:hypothetical protein
MTSSPGLEVLVPIAAHNMGPAARSIKAIRLRTGTPAPLAAPFAVRFAVAGA